MTLHTADLSQEDVTRINSEWQQQLEAKQKEEDDAKRMRRLQEQLANSKGDATLIYDTNAAWTAGLWVKNMTNKAVIAATAAAGIPGPATAYLEDPRTFGISLSFKY